MPHELDPRYDHFKTEEKIYKLWEKSGYFNPDNLPGKRAETYTIMIAPPNITGSLHLGHALENTLSDIQVRYHRMKGFKTLWLPGTDHAGIATQNVVEKELKKQGLTRHDLGKEKFLEKVWEWKNKYGDIILEQLKKLGCSMDWSRTRFTMDEKYQEAVKTAFAHYQKKGLVYRGERVVNWCIKDQTALSDLELEYVEEKSTLWHIRYPIKGGGAHIVVATTRPETMLGDTAVAVNPEDARYASCIGKTAILPIINREIPIIADTHVEMGFGTGAVKVTPAHDMADSEIAERHSLPHLKVISETGKIINTGSEFDGLSMLQAREKVVQKLKELGLVEKEEEFTHNVAKCYRCNSTIEPLLSKQWFLKMQPLAEPAIDAIKNGRVQYAPERWKEISLDWLLNMKDWCISRQIWWGHPIPVEGGTDTFDTWFSSALWPFAALGWPEKNSKDLKMFYPTSFITSAREILHLWISRMIFSGLEFTGEVPFTNVLIHGTILTKDGRRMSKSLGTGIDPLGLIQKYGADATRFGVVWQAMGTQDVRWDETAVTAGQKFCTKLWNIARFVMKKTDGKIYAIETADEFGADDQRFLETLAAAKKQVEKDLKDYRFGQALHALYDFIWHDFADQYIELSKKREDENAKKILSAALLGSLKMLHPFMPFITEEIYQKFLPAEVRQAEEGRPEEMLMIAKW